MADAARADGASKWDAVETAIEKIKADWVPLLGLAIVFAVVVIYVTPHITRAIVADRENKRRHRERMVELKRKLETSRAKRQSGDTGVTRRSGRSDR